MSSRLRFIISTVFVLAFVVGAGTALADWTPPVSNPPTCNSGDPGCDAPVNVSANKQYKPGGLAVGGVVGGVTYFLNSVSDFIVGGPGSLTSIIRTDSVSGTDNKFLDIYSAGPVGGFVSPSTRGARIRLSGNQAVFGATPIGGQVLIDAGNTASSYISLTTNGAEKMRINNNGSVGVGVATLATSPNAIKFGVNGNVGATKYCDLAGTVCKTIQELTDTTGSGTNFWKRTQVLDQLNTLTNWLSPETVADNVSIGEAPVAPGWLSRLHVKGGGGVKVGIDTDSLAVFGKTYIGAGGYYGSNLTIGDSGGTIPAQASSQFKLAISGDNASQTQFFTSDTPANFQANLDELNAGRSPSKVGAGGSIGALGNGGIFYSNYDAAPGTDAAPAALGAFTKGNNTTGLYVNAFGGNGVGARYGIKVQAGQTGIYSRGKIGIFATDSGPDAGEANQVTCPGTAGQMLPGCTNTPRFLDVLNSGKSFAGYFLGNVKVGGSLIADVDASYDGKADVCRRYTDGSGEHFQCLKDLFNSDATLKHNIATISQGLEQVLKLRGVTFDWNDPAHHGYGEQYGVVAQEVEKVIPQVVSADESGIKSVNYNGLVGLLIEAVKDQQKQIDAQQAQIDQLKAQIGSK